MSDKSGVKGLNEFFVSTNSIASENRFDYGSYEWGSKTFGNIIGTRLLQDGSITSAKIGTISNNVLQGGTATFGGADDTDGVILVKNAGGTVVVQIDNTGITVIDGNISIQNDGGTTIIDGSGLTTANFVSDSIVDLGNTRSTSSTSFTDVANTTLTFSLAKTANVLFLAGGDFSNYIADGETCREFVGLNIDGTLYPNATNGFGIVYLADDVIGDDVTNVLPTWAGHYLATLTAGTHTAKLQFCKNDVPTTSVDARVTNTQLSYVVLGA